MIRIIPAEERHIGRVCEIARASFTDPWPEQGYRSELEAGGFFAVAEEDGAVLGFAAARPAGEARELLDIAADERYRRRGVGGALLDAVCAYAAETGAERVWLEVRESNLTAVSFYEKRGFFAVGRRKGYYTGPTEDAVLMDKEIKEKC